MYLFDYLSNQPRNESTEQLLNILKEITCKVVFFSYLAIIHPDFKPFSILDYAVEYIL